MSSIVQTFKTIRNHWKKSIFFSCAFAYGINNVKERVETYNLMRIYCEEAVKYGDKKIPVIDAPRAVTVILNPNANKSKAKVNYEKYAAPLLHLAGISVDVIFTESEGHAKTVIDKIKQTDAIIIAGGNGTVSEVITGILRRCDNQVSNNNIPVGILPLGRSNTLAKSIFPGGDKLANVQSLTDATMAVIKQRTKKIDLMKIEVLDESETSKPIYAVDEIEWGVFRNARAKKDKYWYFGGLRDYATYLFNGSEFQSPCEATIKYSLPCPGCTNCTVTKTERRRWWQRLFSRQPSTTPSTKVNNPECSQFLEKNIATTNITLRTENVKADFETDIPKLVVDLGPEHVGYFNFVRQGWSQNKEIVENVTARQIQIQPTKIDENSNQEISIDNENFELKPISVTLLPKALEIFTKDNK